MVSSTSDIRLKDDKNEAISDDTRVKMYTPAGLMNYSNSRVRGYGLLGNLYLIIDNLNRILIKPVQISVSAMPCFLVGKSREYP